MSKIEFEAWVSGGSDPMALAEQASSSGQQIQMNQGRIQEIEHEMMKLKSQTASAAAQRHRIVVV